MEINGICRDFSLIFKNIRKVKNERKVIGTTRHGGTAALLCI